MFNYSVRQTENIQSTLFPDKENEVQGNQMTCLRSYCFKYKLFHAFHIFKNCGALLKKKKNKIFYRTSEYKRDEERAALVEEVSPDHRPRPL